MTLAGSAFFRRLGGDRPVNALPLIQGIDSVRCSPPDIAGYGTTGVQGTTRAVCTARHVGPPTGVGLPSVDPRSGRG
jgi:hypothetical protein